MNVHYNITTGRIHSWGTVDSDTASSIYPGCAVVNLEYAPVDPKVDKIDVQTLTLAKWSAEEAAQVNSPTVDEVAGMIEQALLLSDRFVSVPDYPITAQEKAQWIVYRAQLRDSSKNSQTVADVLNKIPVNPSGQDPFAAFRERLK